MTEHEVAIIQAFIEEVEKTVDPGWATRTYNQKLAEIKRLLKGE